MTGPEIPGYVKRNPWKPLLGLPVGLAIGLGLSSLPGTWGLWGILAFCVVALGVCAYMLIDLRRDQRRHEVLMRRWKYLIEQDQQRRRD